MQVKLNEKFLTRKKIHSKCSWAAIIIYGLKYDPDITDNSIFFSYIIDEVFTEPHRQSILLYSSYYYRLKMTIHNSEKDKLFGCLEFEIICLQFVNKIKLAVGC